MKRLFLGKGVFANNNKIAMNLSPEVHSNNLKLMGKKCKMGRKGYLKNRLGGGKVTV